MDFPLEWGFITDNDNYDEYLVLGDAFVSAIDWMITDTFKITVPIENSLEVLNWRFFDYVNSITVFMSVVVRIMDGIIDKKHVEIFLMETFDDMEVHMYKNFTKDEGYCYIYFVFWCCYIYCTEFKKQCPNIASDKVIHLLEQIMSEILALNEYAKAVTQHVVSMRESQTREDFSKAVNLYAETRARKKSEQELHKESQKQMESPSPQKVEELMQSLEECMEKNRKLADAVKEKNKENNELREKLAVSQAMAVRTEELQAQRDALLAKQESEEEEMEGTRLPSKLCLLLLKSIEWNDEVLNKHGNKTKFAKLLSYITGFTQKKCQDFFKDRDFSADANKQRIDEINQLLLELEMEPLSINSRKMLL